MTQDSRPAILRVSGQSDASKVAGAIAGVVREHGRCELSAIGAAAVNQAVKAIGIARGYVAAQGMNLVCVPSFVDLELNGEERTAIRFDVKPE